MPYAKNGDINIYYEDEGEGFPLAMLHGRTSSIAGWRNNGYVDALKKEHRLILIDARGHGQSDKPHDSEAYKYECRVGDVLAVLDELDIQKVIVFGYSMGGVVSFHVAQLAPDRVKALIIGGAGPEERHPIDNQPFNKALEGGVEGIIAFFESSGPIPDERMEQLHSLDVKALRALVSVSNPGVINDLPNMTMPIFVFFGEADETGDYRKVKELCKPIPDLTFVSQPGLNHGQTFMRSDLILPHIKEFLAKVNK